MEQAKMDTIRDQYNRLMRVALIKGANIMPGKFRNFSGEKLTGKYDALGKRYMNIQFDNPKVIALLISENYRVNTHTDEYGNIDRGYLQVYVKDHGPYPAKIAVESSGVENLIPSEEWKMLDGLGGENDTIITSGDVVLRLYEYNPGKYSAELYRGTFHLQPITFWTDAWSDEEWPHEG